MLVVRVDGERLSEEQQAAELERGEALGREILGEAHVPHAEILRKREEAARATSKRRAAEAAVRERQSADLAAFMGQRRSRSEALRPGEAEPAEASPSPPASGLSCCVNAAFSSCPSAAAVDQCVGGFTRCICGCGVECMERCLETDPPDPSACAREPSRDGEC